MSTLPTPGRVFNPSARLRRAGGKDFAGVVTLIVLVVLWELGIRAAGMSSALTPSVADIAGVGWQLAGNGDLWRFYSASMARMVTGFAAGTLLGLVLGATFALSVWAERLLGPVLACLRQIPLFGLIPLLGLWFGTGEISKFVMIATAAFYPVLLHAHEGLSNAPAAYRDVARVLRFTRLSTLRKVLVPSAAPVLVTGLKHALAYAWIACVGAELFMPSGPGIGTLLAIGRSELRMDYVLLGVTLVALNGYLLSSVLAHLAARAMPWQSPAVSSIRRASTPASSIPPSSRSPS